MPQEVQENTVKNSGNVIGNDTGGNFFYLNSNIIVK